MKASPREPSLTVVPGSCLAAAFLGWIACGLPNGAHHSLSAHRETARRIAGAENVIGSRKTPATEGGFLHLLAVSEHFSGGPAVRLPATGSLATEEAEELASQLQGEALAARVATDPKAFLTEVARGGYRFRKAALTVWSERDPEGAFQTVLKSRRISSWDAGPVFLAMARHDPAKMQAWLQTAAPGTPAEFLDAAWSNVFKIQAEQDTAGLQAKLGTLGKRAGVAACEAGEAMAQKDLAAAVEWARSLPEKTMSEQVLARIVDSVASTDPERAADYFQYIPNHNTWNIAYQWSNRDPEAALRWLSSHPDSPLQEAICNNSLKKAAASNAAAAQSFLTSLPVEKQMEATSQIAAGMAESDPAAALRWASALPDEAQRRNALKMAALSNRDESLAAQFTALVPEAAPAMIFKTDAAGAARSLAALSPEQQLAAWNCMSNYTSTDPVACAGLVEELPEGTLRSQAISNVAALWSSAAPVATSAWVERLPEGESRVWAVENLMNNWGRYDFSAAQRWTDALAPGATKDKATEILQKSEPAKVKK